jgi:hypothetical protein
LLSIEPATWLVLLEAMTVRSVGAARLASAAAAAAAAAAMLGPPITTVG